MRIVVHTTGETGARAARILLGERDLGSLGMYRRRLTHADDPRAHAVDGLEGFEVVVSDEVDDPAGVARRALDVGASCVLWSDLWRDRDEAAELGEAFAAAGSSLVVGASLGPGIAAGLASHEVARTDSVLELTIGWTVPGRPLRRGEPLPFPEPVGSLWGTEATDDDPPSTVPTRRFVAPTQGPWAGAVARTTGVLAEGVARRVVGVADHAAHLEGIALAAGGVAAGMGAYPPGLQWAGSVDAYLERALIAGLAVATFTVETPSHDRP